MGLRKLMFRKLMHFSTDKKQVELKILIMAHRCQICNKIFFFNREESYSANSYFRVVVVVRVVIDSIRGQFVGLGHPQNTPQMP